MKTLDKIVDKTLDIIGVGVELAEFVTPIALLGLMIGGIFYLL